MRHVGKNAGQCDAQTTMPALGAKQSRMEIRCLGTTTSKGRQVVRVKAPSELNCGWEVRGLLTILLIFLLVTLSLILLTFYVTYINVSV